MKFRLEATPAELWQKGTALVEELADAFSGLNPDLSDRLEKALPPKEQELKYPALQGLRDITTREYEAMLKRMLAEVGKVLNQSLTGPTGGMGLEKSGRLSKQEEPPEAGEESDKLEPGDVDPETGELIPEEDEEDEEPEEPEEGEEKSLEKAMGGVGGVERTYKVRGHPEVIDQLDALLLTANKLCHWGASRDVTMSVDGDGPHFLEVEGTEGELAKRALEDQINKDEIKAYQVKLEKALLTEQEVRQRAKEYADEIRAAAPLQHDFTKPIADKDARAYERVKRVLLDRGYAETEFEEGGRFYGYSVNQLIQFIRNERKVAQ